MIIKELKFGGRQVLPSAFPYFSSYELKKLSEKNFFERVGFFADAFSIQEEAKYNFEPQCVEICDGLVVSDISCGGSELISFSKGVSPYIIATIYSLLESVGAFDEELDFCLALPEDGGVLISAVAAKLCGMPIDKIVVPCNEDIEGKNVVGINISEEDISEYMLDFVDDFDFALGIEDARAILCGEIYSDGFNLCNVLALCAFGMFTSLEKNAFVYMGKSGGIDLEKKIAEHFALSIPQEKCSRTCGNYDKISMIELCNILNSYQT